MDVARGRSIRVIVHGYHAAVGEELPCLGEVGSYSDCLL